MRRRRAAQAEGRAAGQAQFVARPPRIQAPQLPEFFGARGPIRPPARGREAARISASLRERLGEFFGPEQAGREERPAAQFLRSPAGLLTMALLGLTIAAALGGRGGRPATAGAGAGGKGGGTGTVGRAPRRIPGLDIRVGGGKIPLRPRGPVTAIDGGELGTGGTTIINQVISAGLPLLLGGTRGPGPGFGLAPTAAIGPSAGGLDTANISLSVGTPAGTFIFPMVFYIVTSRATAENMVAQGQAKVVEIVEAREKGRS